MGDLPGDVVEFIDQHFHPNDVPAARTILGGAELSTPRILRAVLFLSNGSLTLLRHYVDMARRDVREVLTNAEYVIGVSEMPMPVRDLSLPFNHERNRASWPAQRAAVGSRTTEAESTRRGPARAGGAGDIHVGLLRRSFQLGRAVYTVASEQPRRDRVRCFRKVRNLVQVVSLPLVFVLEQFAEHIELTEAR